MVHPIALVGLLALAAAAYGDVDFTPHESFYYAEAVKQPCVAFRKGDAPVQYSPPGKWTLSGGGNKVTLTPPEIPQAEAVMQTRPAKTGLVPATEDSIKTYSDLAVSLLARESSKIVVAEAKLPTIKYSGHAMVEVTLNYVLFGQAFTANYLFLPYDKELIIFQFTARTPDYAPLARLFRASLFSISGL